MKGNLGKCYKYFMVVTYSTGKIRSVLLGSMQAVAVETYSATTVSYSCKLFITVAIINEENRFD
jgi:hypothetical protein